MQSAHNRMEQAIERIKVLYLDDEEGNLLAFRASFRREFEVHTAVSPAAALAWLEKNTAHVVISDQRMPGTTGALVGVLCCGLVTLAVGWGGGGWFGYAAGALVSGSTAWLLLSIAEDRLRHIE